MTMQQAQEHAARVLAAKGAIVSPTPITVAPLVHGGTVRCTMCNFEVTPRRANVAADGGGMAKRATTA